MLGGLFFWAMQQQATPNTRFLGWFKKMYQEGGEHSVLADIKKSSAYCFD
jgi:hypothetical protein